MHSSAANLFAYIPSPSRGVIELGPIPLRAYGFLMAFGVLVAVQIAERRWQARGGEKGVVSSLALWVVGGGLLGARIYHVITDFERYQGAWLDTLKVWQGGLSIWGAVLGGAAAATVVARLHHLDQLAFLDSCAPGVVLAQAIGRWGNWFNQELFGKPTTRPWGLEILPEHRPSGYLEFETFHPTFLYESLWALGVFAVLMRLDRRGIKGTRLARGQLVAAYGALYTFGRFWFENLRIDEAHVIGPLRINAWVSLIAFTGCSIWFVIAGRRALRTQDAPDSDQAIPKSEGTDGD